MKLHCTRGTQHHKKEPCLPVRHDQDTVKAYPNPAYLLSLLLSRLSTTMGSPYLALRSWKCAAVTWYTGSYCCSSMSGLGLRAVACWLQNRGMEPRTYSSSSRNVYIVTFALITCQRPAGCRTEEWNHEPTATTAAGMCTFNFCNNDM